MNALADDILVMARAFFAALAVFFVLMGFLAPQEFSAILYSALLMTSIILSTLIAVMLILLLMAIFEWIRWKIKGF